MNQTQAVDEEAGFESERGDMVSLPKSEIGMLFC